MTRRKTSFSVSFTELKPYHLSYLVFCFVFVLFFVFCFFCHELETVETSYFLNVRQIEDSMTSSYLEQLRSNSGKRDPFPPLVEISDH